MKLFDKRTSSEAVVAVKDPLFKKRISPRYDEITSEITGKYSDDPEYDEGSKFAEEIVNDAYKIWFEEYINNDDDFLVYGDIQEQPALNDSGEKPVNASLQGLDSDAAPAITSKSSEGIKSAIPDNNGTGDFPVIPQTLPVPPSNTEAYVDKQVQTINKLTPGMVSDKYTDNQCKAPVHDEAYADGTFPNIAPASPLPRQNFSHGSSALPYQINPASGIFSDNYSSKLPVDSISDTAIQKGNLKYLNAIIYAYVENSYKPLDCDMLKGMVLKYCSYDLAKTKDNHIINAIYTCIRAKLSLEKQDVSEDPDHIVFRDCRFNLLSSQFEMNGPDVISFGYVNVCIRGASNKHPMFSKYLDRVTGGDERLERLIWEIIGYILSPSMAAKKFFVFFGPSGTGKSLMLRIIRSFFIPNSGECAIQLHSLGERFSLGRISGVRLVTDGDYAGAHLSDSSTATIKAITGGDSVRAEMKGQDAVTVKPGCKLLIASNYIPQPKKVDEAFEKRRLIVPFVNVIPDEEQDPDLFEKIIQELPAIAMTALSCLITLRENKYRFTRIDLSEYQPKEDFHSSIPINSIVTSADKMVSDFVDSYCIFVGDSFTLTEELFSVFKSYCAQAGQQVLNIKDFSTRLSRIFPGLSKRKSGTKNGYVGIALKSHIE